MRGSWFVSDSWDFAPYLMCSDDATRVVAMRRVLIGGFFAWPLGFPLFSVVWALVFKLPSPFISPFTYPNFLIHCFESLPLRLLLRLLRLCSSDFSLPIYAAFFQGMFLLSFPFFFLRNLLWVSDFSPFFPFLFTMIVLVLWFLGFSVYFILFALFLGVHGW